MNKEIVIKTTIKKELIKSVFSSLVISIIQSYLFYLTLDTGIKIRINNQTFDKVPHDVVIVLIPIIFIVCMLFYIGKMVGKGYFAKGGKKK